MSSEPCRVWLNIPEALNKVGGVVEPLHWLHALRLGQLRLIVLQTEIDIVILGFTSDA